METAIPVIGPFFALSNANSSSFGAVATFWLIFDAAAQSAGLAMLIAGFARKHKYPVYERMQLLPSGGTSGAGMTLMGRFYPRIVTGGNTGQFIRGPFLRDSMAARCNGAGNAR